MSLWFTSNVDSMAHVDVSERCSSFFFTLNIVGFSCMENYLVLGNSQRDRQTKACRGLEYLDDPQP